MSFWAYLNEIYHIRRLAWTLPLSLVLAAVVTVFWLEGFYAPLLAGVVSCHAGLLAAVRW